MYYTIEVIIIIEIAITGIAIIVIAITEMTTTVSATILTLKYPFISTGSLRLKVRQHVNPLASRYLIPMEGGEEWVRKAFSNTTRPVVVDIG